MPLIDFVFSPGFGFLFCAAATCIAVARRRWELASFMALLSVLMVALIAVEKIKAP